MDDSEQIKEVYAHFGLAMYVAQCVEQSIILLLIFHDFFPKNIASKIHLNPKLWADRYDEFEEIVSSKTMGRLIKHLMRVKELTKPDLTSLQAALEKRNWLAHSYFSQNAQYFTFEEGRQKMVKELEECRDSLGDVDVMLMKSIDLLCKKYGMSEEQFERIKEEIVNEAKSSD